MVPRWATPSRWKKSRYEPLAGFKQVQLRVFAGLSREFR